MTIWLVKTWSVFSQSLLKYAINITADKGLCMFLYFLQNQILPLTISKKSPTQYVPRAENYNDKNMPKYIDLKMLEIFNHLFFAVCG